MTFSPIKVLEIVVNTLEQKGTAIVVGYPGSGKSFIGMEVLRSMHLAERVVLTFDCAELWNELVNPKQGYIVFIDDFLGAFNITEAEITKLMGYFNTMYACVKNTETKIILTVRKSIYERWRERLEEASKLFSQDVIIDLTEEKNHLSVDEKKYMLEKHLQTNGIEIVRTKKETAESEGLSIDQFTVNEISKKNAYNFPLLCFLFAKNENRMRLGEKFFEQPLNTLRRTIDGLRKSKSVQENWRYAFLSYCAIIGDKVNPRTLRTDLFTSICNSLELKSDVRLELKAIDAVEDLKDEYLKEVGRDTYEFIHQSFLEASIISYGKVRPDLVIECCSRNILFELIRTHLYQEKKDEFVLKLDKEYFNVLMIRFIAEINSNQESIPHVLLHPVMKDENFSDEFFTNLQSRITAKTMSSEVVHSLLTEASRLGHLTCVETCFSSCISQDMIEKALNIASYRNHAKLVVFLSCNSKVKLDPYFLQACSFGCENVVSSMLENKLIRGSELIVEGLFRAAKTEHVRICRILSREYTSVASTDEFKCTMLKILKDAIDAGKINTARELIFKENLIFEDQLVQNLVLAFCDWNHLELAKDIVREYMHRVQPRAVDLNSFVQQLLVSGNSLCIDLVFEMMDVAVLRNFFNEDNIKIIVKSTGFGGYVVEKAYKYFPKDVGSVCCSPYLIYHFLRLGNHSLVSHLCQANAELCKTLRKSVIVSEKYGFEEFAVYCGFFDFQIIKGESKEERESLLFHCVEGYLNKGVMCMPDKFKSYAFIDFFHTTSRQESYLLCMKKLYMYDNNALELDKDSEIIKTIRNILCSNFKPKNNCIEFINDITEKMHPQFIRSTFAEKKVMKLLRHILLQSLDLSEIRQMIEAWNE